MNDQSYTGKVWFHTAPFGFTYRCRACQLKCKRVRCRGFFHIDSNNEPTADWNDCCVMCGDKATILIYSNFLAKYIVWIIRAYKDARWSYRSWRRSLGV